MIVYPTVSSGTDQRKHKSSESPVNPPHKGQVTRKMFPFDDVIMLKKLCMHALSQAKMTLYNHEAINCQFQGTSGRCYMPQDQPCGSHGQCFTAHAIIVRKTYDWLSSVSTGHQFRSIILDFVIGRFGHNVDI